MIPYRDSSTAAATYSKHKNYCTTQHSPRTVSVTGEPHVIAAFTYCYMYVAIQERKSKALARRASAWFVELNVI